ncbi:hypothetical protein U1Q18_033878 [Sarracenia purpurea var. burkii]
MIPVSPSSGSNITGDGGDWSGDGERMEEEERRGRATTAICSKGADDSDLNQICKRFREVRDVLDLMVRRLWSMILAPSTKEKRRRRSGVGEAEAAA